MLKIPYEPNDLCLHVEFYDGKFYLSRLPDRRNLQRVTEARESPEAFRVMRTKQGIKLDSYLLSGMQYNNSKLVLFMFYTFVCSFV